MLYAYTIEISPAFIVSLHIHKNQDQLCSHLFYVPHIYTGSYFQLFPLDLPLHVFQFLVLAVLISLGK